MSAAFTLTKLRIHAGVYHGELTCSESEQSTPELHMYYLGQPVAEFEVTAVGDDPKKWLVSAPLPSEILGDGIHGCSIACGDETLDQFSIVMGEALDDDLRHELSILRGELDILKRAFRRHCVETEK